MKPAKSKRLLLVFSLERFKDSLVNRRIVTKVLFCVLSPTHFHRYERKSYAKIEVSYSFPVRKEV